MTRLTDTILGQNPFAYGGKAPAVNLPLAASHGWEQDYRAYVAATPYARKDAIPVVMELPRALSRMSNSGKIGAIFKTLLEDMPVRINGIDLTQTTEFAEHDFGGGGAKIYIPMGATRQEAAPSYDYQEKQGKIIQKAFTWWSRTLLFDAQQRYPNIINTSALGSDLLIDEVAATVMYIEPDPTGRYALDACLCLGMMPKTDGQRSMKRDRSNGESLEFSIEFTATTQEGTAILQAAQNYLDGINRGGLSPTNRQAYISEIAADVAALKAGIKNGIDQIANSAVSV